MGTSVPSSSNQHPTMPNGAATYDSIDIHGVPDTSETVEQAPHGSQPPRLHPELYKAAVEGDVTVLSKHDHSALQRVSMGGNTLLHIAATSSNDLPLRPHLEFIRKVYNKHRHMIAESRHLEFIKKIYNEHTHLLMETNMFRETPLHSAAKAGSKKIVDLLIKLANEYLSDDNEMFQTFLKAKNNYGETALHEAVRVGHTEMVQSLIDSLSDQLMNVSDNNGVSPLYLATMTNKHEVVQIFTKHEKNNVCCDGPRGQNALHAAVLDNTEITRELLKWNDELATKQDSSGSTPLHYAASVGNLETVNLLLNTEQGKSTAYVQATNGLYPIHVAAQCGRTSVIKRLMEEFPDSHELVDDQGRNFLHIAIESGNDHKLSYLPKMHMLLNSRDKEGNTPLHLASENGDIRFVKFLISCTKLCPSIMNNEGLTPLDLGMKKMEQGFVHRLNIRNNLVRLLMWADAIPSPRRLDLLQDELRLPRYETEIEIKRAETVIRNLGIIAVLVATITFAATFSMPGGYIADPGPHTGSAVLSRKFLFKAFIIANTVAFVFSTLATSWLVYAGSSNVDFRLRMRCLVFSIKIVKIATKSTVAAFCLAVSAVLYEVNLLLIILIFVFTFVIVLLSNPSIDAYLLKVPIIWKRKGFKGYFKPVNPMTRNRVAVGMGRTYSYLFFKVNVGVDHKLSVAILTRLIRNFVFFSIIFGLAYIT